MAQGKAIFGIQPELPYSIEEAVNRLRVNINFLGEDVKKIMIVSTTANEGKSFVTMQLWRQIAESGTKALFIDADLRNSQLANKYDIQKENGEKIQGTSHYLSGDVALEDAILKGPYEGGDILVNTSNVVKPSLLIENHRFSDLLDYGQENYRYTFLDCPPLGLVSDGEQIANMCDGAILVVRAGDTPKMLIHDSIAELERAGCPLLGIVLNRVDITGKSYYHKYYGGKKYYGKYYGGSNYYGGNATNK